MGCSVMTNHKWITNIEYDIGMHAYVCELVSMDISITFMVSSLHRFTHTHTNARALALYKLHNVIRAIGVSRHTCKQIRFI